MTTYRAYESTGQGDLTLVERELRPPAAGEVRIRVHSCGVCHTEAMLVEGETEPQPPLVPGHEIVGVIEEVGSGVHAWAPGDRVGVGFLGGHCNECEFCRRGDFVNCTDQPQVGLNHDGGYAEVVYTRATGVVRVPQEFDAKLAAPLLCAGLTVYNALRHIDAVPGALVAIQGIGGLGHLGVQYAKALGYSVAAIARGQEKAELARKLGADVYIDSAAVDAGSALLELGGAAAIVATATNGASMGPLVNGLRPRGQFIVVGAAPDPLSVQTLDLILAGRSIVGSLTGSSIDNEDNLAFTIARGIAPMIEVIPFEEAPKAYARMMSGQARFRVVLDIAGSAS
ncbi:alcohol dehydrogenase catalytic domain-containing protein [Mycobacterium aquaticum]|uniref:Alcohol dehydrogenase n=1 Tax=Mycobacterium aquaticum TaxID=1927124 RepID=A0A1X0BCT4_9MYCO|nr:alcohol dehydrogenase catalytic domain-containing protein [Mycobacterium aquaticum]ORA40104.1 alcohol dehydrogenase [Mycobacterium aquaticum]